MLVALARATLASAPAGTIGVQSLRGGDNPGEHSVLFLGRGERLELVHRAATRDHFAAGAVRAARWLRGQAPGPLRASKKCSDSRSSTEFLDDAQ